MDIWCILTLGSLCTPSFNIKGHPLELYFEHGDYLQVALHSHSIPRGYSNYIIKYYGESINKGRFQKITLLRIQLKEHYEYSSLKIIIQKHDGSSRKEQEFLKLLPLQDLSGRKRDDACIKRKCVINLDWRNSNNVRPGRGEIYYTAAQIQSRPQIISFKNGNVLNVAYELKNLPEQHKPQLFFFFETYTNKYEITSIEQTLNQTMDDWYIGVHTCYNDTKTCAKVETLRIIKLKYNARRPDTYCLAEPCTIVLDWENKYLSDIGSSISSGKAGDSKIVWVTPQTYIDNGGAFAEFTCHAKGDSLDRLSWYQDTGNNKSQLIMKQFPRSETTTEMALVLKKALSDADKGTSIYCFLRKEIGSPVFSEMISLTFTRNIMRETPYIKVEPGADVATFTANTTRSFECGGSEPVDGRSFNWYIEGVPYSNNFSQVPAKNMIPNPNSNNVTLTLYLDESFHSKRIYCVQEYHMVLERSDGDLYDWSYGEHARSNMILLSMVADQHTDANTLENESNQGFPSLPIYLGVAAALLATLSALVIRWKCRKRGNNHTIPGSLGNNNESLYATAQITYAELQLSAESGKILRKEDPTPYAEVVGSCKPKTKH